MILNGASLGTLVDVARDADIAPWWGVPVIAGAFLILGAVLGFWSNWLLEARKQSRTEALRWDADIRQYSAELLGAVRETFNERRKRDAFTAGHAWSLRRELEKKPVAEVNMLLREGEDVEAYIKRDTHFRRYDAPFFKESEQRSAASWERIESLTASLSLVAPETVRASAEDLVASLNDALQTDDDDDVPRSARAALAKAREGLVVAVREHLGFSGRGPKAGPT